MENHRCVTAGTETKMGERQTDFIHPQGKFTVKYVTFQGFGIVFIILKIP